LRYIKAKIAAPVWRLHVVDVACVLQVRTFGRLDLAQ
jgi:hypothetical protein